MLALDFAMQATLVVATSVLGAMVFLAAPRRAPNLALAAFFFLIAGNQAVESLRRIIDPASPTLWAAGVFAALDPIALYYFVAIYPKPNRLRSALPFGIVLGAGWSLALLAGWQGAQPLTSSQIWLLTSVFTAIVYTVLFAHIVNASKATPSDPAIRLLLPAFAVAAMPTWARTVEAGPSLLPSGLVTVERGLILAAGLAVLLSLAAIIALAARSPVSIRRPFLAGATLGALIAAIPLIRAASRADLLPFADPVALTWTAVAARWLVFGLLVSIAVLRYDFLGMSLKTRRHTARALVIGVVLAVAALALASARQAWEGAWIPLTIAEVAVLAVVLVASQGFRGLVDRLAEKVYGVPMPGDTAASLERYRSAVEAVLREGRGLDELVRLRDELGLDPRSAALIETAILGPRTGFSAGERIAGRYTIERVLGRGSQSIAYLATEGGRHLVVKEIHAAGSSQALHEVRALTTARHPNVLAVLDVIEKDARVMIVTEYASEGSLDELLATRGRLSVSESRPIIAGILAGLSHVHAKGIVHGDLKPANILLANGLTPKIGDFGLARFIHEATSSPGAAAIAGTPAYLAPELRRGERATLASDLYAVGLIAKRAIKDIPPDLGEVLDRATRSEMAERFPDAETMRAAFLRAIQEPHDPRSFVRPGPAES